MYRESRVVLRGDVMCRWDEEVKCDVVDVKSGRSGDGLRIVVAR